MATHDEEVRRTYTVEEAATILGIGRNCAYEAVRRGEIPVIRLGRRLLVPKPALDSLLSGGSPQTDTEQFTKRHRGVRR